MPDIQTAEKLYAVLSNSYILAKERNETLIARAQNLMGFAGIIDTLLVAIIVAATTQDKFRSLLESSSYNTELKTILIIGLLAYIVATVFTIGAYRTTKYKAAPEIPDMGYINDVFRGSDFSLRPFAVQLFDATNDYNQKNEEKFNSLFFATLFFIIAIVFTALLGIFMVLYMI